GPKAAQYCHRSEMVSTRGRERREKKTAAPRERSGRKGSTKSEVRNLSRRSVRPGASGFPHTLGDDPDFLDAGTLCRVDDVDDVLVAQRAGRHDEHRLVFALLVDVAQPGLELLDGDVLLVDRDP